MQTALKNNTQLLAANHKWERDYYALTESRSTCGIETPTKTEDSPCVACANREPPPCTTESYDDLVARKGVYLRLDVKDLLSKAAQLRQSEADRHAISIACDRALSERNAAIAEPALLMSASMRHDVHVAGELGRLHREHYIGSVAFAVPEY